MALVLPFTYTMDPPQTIALLACVYIGAEYGGSIPAILIRTPSRRRSDLNGGESVRSRRPGRDLDPLPRGEDPCAAAGRGIPGKGTAHARGASHLSLPGRRSGSGTCKRGDVPRLHLAIDPGPADGQVFVELPADKCRPLRG
jgi:hypothetical protein